MDLASSLIDRKITELGDWRGKMLAKVRGIAPFHFRGFKSLAARYERVVCVERI
jgi:hypothetical protein